MEPVRPDETPTLPGESPPVSATKSYAKPELTEHGKLPPLTLGGSLTDTE
jgi:hypothetical protein